MLKKSYWLFKSVAIFYATLLGEKGSPLRGLQSTFRRWVTGRERDSLEGKELYKGQMRGFVSLAYGHHTFLSNRHIPLSRVNPSILMSFAGLYPFAVSCCKSQRSTQSAELMEQTSILSVLAHQHAYTYEDTLPRPQRSIFPQPLLSVQACSQFQMTADAIWVRAVMQASVNPQLEYIAPSYGPWPSCTADHNRDKREVLRKAKGVVTCMTKNATIRTTSKRRQRKQKYITGAVKHNE